MMKAWIDLFEFKWKFFVGKTINLIYPHKAENFPDQVIFATHEGTKDWILGAKARRLSRAMGDKAKVHYTTNFNHLPYSKGYFFLHQNYYAKALKRNAFLFNKDVKSFVMFTHPSFDKAFSQRHIVHVLQYAHKIVCLNSEIKSKLIEYGVDDSKILVWHMASNPEFFTSKEKVKGNTVGLSMAYYERKNPDLMFQIINHLPQVNFYLLGIGWEKYSRMNDLLKLPNFTYYPDLAYERYPELYNKMDVFLSTSNLEGGPVPLLEAMLMNVVPVVSRTGFCPDIVNHGVNGYLFDINENHEKVSDLIIKALKENFTVRDSVINYSWNEFGQKLDLLYRS